MISQGLTVTELPPEERQAPPTLSPQLLWPTLSATDGGDYGPVASKKCPSLDSIQARKGKAPLALLPCFLSALIGATSVKILDPFVDDGVPSDFFKAVEHATSLRVFIILTKASSKGKELENRLREAAGRSVQTGQPAPTIEVLGGIDSEKHSGCFHDRFALLDHELWHFGANVGGSHKGLNAYSRGWTDDAVGFSTMFDQLRKALQQNV